MKGHFYKPSCKCDGNRCKCGATWSYIVDVGINPATGKRMQKKKGGFATKAAAEAHLAELLVSVNNNTFKNESNLTFEAFSAEWLELYRMQGTTKISTHNVRVQQSEILNKHIGKLPLKNLNRIVLQDMINLLSKSYSNNSMIGLVSTLKMILKKAHEYDQTNIDHTQYLYVPKKQKNHDEDGLVKYLEKQDLKKFLETCKEKTHHQEYLLFLTLAYTGMRIGELLALKWSDIDFNNQTINITRTLVYGGSIDRYALQTPKTKQSKREIYISETLISEFEKYRHTYNEFRLRNINNFHNENFIFINLNKYKGYPKNQMLMNKRMKILLDKAKLPKTLTTHSLRHTHTSLLAEAGVSLEAIMERLGHKDSKVTRQVYLHVTKSVKKEASDKFGKLMDSP